MMIPESRFCQNSSTDLRCDSDLMLARRLKRDITERGRTVDGVLEQYDDYLVQQSV